jgi:UDP-N-acetylglucosamine diphosphorylase / glucose-1-phosphate thymidylyltransferase / UDP-N-acetylgalactosamine diphosphorylase / glucosamine-1-phosphate N-acetyltransferase / galactosamine-1-phosphate N-acetyltransferase
MTRPTLILFDDDDARAWRPFTLTRPAGELLFGTRTLRQRAEDALGLECAGHLTAEHLADYHEPWAPPVLDPAGISREHDIVFVRSRFVVEAARLPDGPALFVDGDRVVGARVPAGHALPGPEFFRDPDGHSLDLPRRPLEGDLIDTLWSVMNQNAERVARDLDGASSTALPAHVHQLGDGTVSIGGDVDIAPGVVLDTRAGPIRLDDGVIVRPFTYLVGPAYVGAGTTLLGGPFQAVSIGPRCKVHGEIEESVVLGYSNKAHDGFLGHSYLGMWVNLGALTTNSDLKNNYGRVRVWSPTGEVDTGMSKVGCFLGDHVKTAIGTMINTGTVIETGTNVFGGMPPKYLPPFSWGDAGSVYEFERFIDTARTVMGRRDVPLTDRGLRLLETAWRLTQA